MEKKCTDVSLSADGLDPGYLTVPGQSLLTDHWTLVLSEEGA